MRATRASARFKCLCSVYREWPCGNPPPPARLRRAAGPKRRMIVVAWAPTVEEVVAALAYPRVDGAMLQAIQPIHVCCALPARRRVCSYSVFPSRAAITPPVLDNLGFGYRRRGKRWRRRSQRRRRKQVAKKASSYRMVRIDPPRVVAHFCGSPPTRLLAREWTTHRLGATPRCHASVPGKGAA